MNPENQGPSSKSHASRECVRPPTKGSYSEYDPKEIEPRWRRFWDKAQTFCTNDPLPHQKTFYCLDMFPYPSGTGLHVGHPVGYIASDIVSRMKRMQGFNVLHPMGWDAFGLPAEQHAIATGQHPSLSIKQNAARYKDQMQMMGLSFDWNREVSTTDPVYMRWTQWMFVKLYESWFDRVENRARPISELKIPDEVVKQGGHAVREYQDSRRLVYFDEVNVNWCPSLGVVLSNEEVFNGKSEKGHPVVRMPMRQALMRITEFADRLLEGLDGLDWPEHIKDQQRNWIGRREGYKVSLMTENGDSLAVFLENLEKILDGVFVAVAPEHPSLRNIVKQECEVSVGKYIKTCQSLSELARSTSKDYDGVFTGSYAINPITKAKMPIYVAAHVLPEADWGAVIGSPKLDERDSKFCLKYGESQEAIIGGSEVITNLWRQAAHLEALGDDAGLEKLRGQLREAVVNEMLDGEIASPAKVYRLRDWVFSRQRYWGEPIPLVHWEDGSTTCLDLNQLPLTLPELQDYSPKDGQSALARADSWVNVEDSNGRRGKREVLTMPQWAGSCWYSLRFMDPANHDAIVRPELEKAWKSVDLYVGGAEHATLHLLYSRFWFQALHDLGVVQTSEPFTKLFNQGMLGSFAYQTDQGVIVPVDQVKQAEDGNFYHNVSGEQVTRVTAKMSKSLKNVVNPDDVIADHGADAFRVHLMFMGPVEGPRSWDTRTLAGAVRFIRKSYDLIAPYTIEGGAEFVPDARESVEVKRRVDECITKVTSDIENLRHHTAIAELMKCINDLRERELSRASAEVLVKLLSPFVPFVAEELWFRLGHKESISKAQWPESSGVVATAAELSPVLVQVNGRKRGVVEVSVKESEETCKTRILEYLRQQGVANRDTAQVFVVKDKRSGAIRLVNVVVPH